jgi:DNA-binding NarL/FixJ family response regulator
LIIRRRLADSCHHGNVSATLLERGHEVATIARAARQAAAGEGQVVLVYGEAGIGKSRIVEAVRGFVPAEGRVLVGRCDDLATARPLGPFHDLADHVGRDLAAALGTPGVDRDRVLAALRAELAFEAKPTLLAIEDVHWADEATLDVLLYLVRRIGQLPAVLLLTYRDDEIAADHPLQRVLGQAAGTGRAVHLPLRRLSAAAVRRLTGDTDLDADEVYAVTAGNPFFVGEVLAAGSATGVPRTVVAAVMARVRDLPPETRTALEHLAVLPKAAIPRRFVDDLLPDGLAVLAPAEERGLLTVTPTRVSFGHELSRRAILDSLPTVHRVRYHAAALAVLIMRADADVTQLLHHAAEAGDDHAIVAYGPRAAREAATGGAHRQAVAHYRLVSEHADAYAGPERAMLLEEYALECYTIGQYVLATAVQQQAIDLRRALGDDAAVGTGLVWLSRMLKVAGDQDAAETAAEDAVRMLEPLGHTRELALAYTHLASLHLYAYRFPAALPLAERAVALARDQDDVITLSHALNTFSACRWDLYGDGHSIMEESLQVALQAGAPDPACRAYLNLACSMIDRFRLDEAGDYVAAGRQYAEDTEHLGALRGLTVLSARIALGRGDWDEAERIVAPISLTEPMHGSLASMVFGRIAARRGAAEGQQLLAQAVDLAGQTGDLQRIAWTAAAAAEQAWLRGDLQGVSDVARKPFEQAHELDAAVLWPELAYWLVRAGRQLDLRKSDSPFVMLVRGDWRAAAEIWQAAGHRYEYALALSESGDPDQLRFGLEVLDGLEARPLAQLVRKRLRDLGEPVPRGPVAATRRNPAGLTARQLDVMRLLCDGLSDAMIAERLVLSVRTANNHVAAVLSQLGVSSRQAAVARWAELSEGDT